MRVTNKDLDRAIKVVDHRDAVVKTDNLTGYINLPASKSYLLPSGDLVDEGSDFEESQVCGSVQKGSNGSETYKVLANHLNQLYRPKDGQYQRESENRARVAGREPYKMISINKEAFERYTAFLKTGDNGHIRVAEAIMNR